MDHSAERSAGRFDAGALTFGTGDRENHPLPSLDPLGRGHAQAVAGHAKAGHELDGQVSFRRIVEEHDHSRQLWAVLDKARANLGGFHRLERPRVSGTVQVPVV